jgi:hypothetical protein
MAPIELRQESAAAMAGAGADAQSVSTALADDQGDALSVATALAGNEDEWRQESAAAMAGTGIDAQSVATALADDQGDALSVSTKLAADEDEWRQESAAAVARPEAPAAAGPERAAQAQWAGGRGGRVQELEEGQSDDEPQLPLSKRLKQWEEMERRRSRNDKLLEQQKQQQEQEDGAALESSPGPALNAFALALQRERISTAALNKAFDSQKHRKG